MDHFWIILGPFSTILLTILSTLCQWSCGLLHHFLEAKLLDQVNLHFWIIYNTHCWFNMLLCTCTLCYDCACGRVTSVLVLRMCLWVSDKCVGATNVPVGELRVWLCYHFASG